MAWLGPSERRIDADALPATGKKPLIHVSYGGFLRC